MMKPKVVGIFSIVFLLASVADALRHDQGIYNEANKLYRVGQYEEAIALYQNLLEQGLKNGYVYYNLGNAHYKTGRLGQAIFAYERALKLLPGDGDILANLRFVNALKVDKESEDKRNLLTRFLVLIYNLVGIDSLAVICSVCLFFMAGIAILMLFFPSRRVVWIGLLCVFGFGLMGSCMLMVIKVDQLRLEEGVILSEEVVGRSGPGDIYLQVFTIHEGTKVRIERAEKGWLLIRLKNGIGGWIPLEVLGRIL